MMMMMMMDGLAWLLVVGRSRSEPTIMQHSDFAFSSFDVVAGRWRRCVLFFSKADDGTMDRSRL